ncbi:MAG: hypothetical protein EBU90_23480 [Proteobacteria bacterium]|nr:hypothetical protein [Pseudomonadota bacterium]NBP16586.1 hypothetical protein [bacterium]
MIAKKQNDIDSLPKLSNLRYENIFRVYTDTTKNKQFYYYNITNKVSLPSQIDSELLDVVVVDKKTSWTTLSYGLYGSIYLWYLIFILNPTQNKFFVNAGETIKFIKPEYLNTVVNTINE